MNQPSASVLAQAARPDAGPVGRVKTDQEPLHAAPKVSVVIPVHGRPKELAECLSLVLDQTLPSTDYEVLVCDDGSPKEAAEQIQAICASHANVRYLSQQQAGPAAARNLGIAHARADIVAFTDSDTLPCRDWIAALVKPFSEKSVVLVEGPVRTPRLAESPLEEAPRSEGGVFLTANIAYRRWALLAAGGLDATFPKPAFEDVDLALAVRSLGRFAFAPQAVVVHPWRKVTWKSSLKRLFQFDWLLTTALRYGCLGWEDRPTKHPRLRVALAAAVTLPLGRIRKGVSFFSRSPKDSTIRIALGVVEAVLGMLLLPRWLFGRYQVSRPRSLRMQAPRSFFASRLPRVAIVLVHYKNADETIACVRSLQTLTYGNCEIIVVDNASGDGSGDRLRAELPFVRHLTASENGGYTSGNNLGIEAALRSGAGYVHILNPDTIVLNADYLSELVDFLDHHPEVGAAGPRVHLRQVGHIQNTVLRYPWLWRRVIDGVRYRLGKRPLRSGDELVEAEVLNGVCVLFRSDCLRQVGAFDEATFAYIEDVEWSYRAERLGWKRVYLPIDAVVHLQKSTGYERCSRVDYLLKRNTLYFLLKTGRTFQAVGYSLAIAALAAALLVRGVLTREFAPAVQWTKALGQAARGLWRHDFTVMGRPMW